MELRHLRYFVAIAEEHSFTRAAERLWVAQPGLSTQIRRLEAELGVQLFSRHTRGVDLTDAGVLFLERARTTLAAAEIARHTGRDLQAGVLGAVRLGLATTPRWDPVASLLDAFARDRPAVEVTIIESYGGALARDLRDGRLDAVLAPSIFGSAELDSLHVGSEPWVVLVGAGHRLAIDGPLAVEELRGEDVVVTGHRDGAGYDRAVADTLAGLGVNPVLRRGGPGPALLASVADGDAVALSTGSAGLRDDLIARPLCPVQTLNFELFWQAEAVSPALTELIRAAGDRAAYDGNATRPPLRAVA
ncbi:MAG TPA: LysR family transcriptional regulator [Solirubrobacteraceae bacterium]|nr:LysR family transcriptional regulator [Solirubrobacteraceae bacterium]HME03036.1 LysR family transcriptional regulator [Solirubrobacteraceae bacterium]